MLNGYLGFVRGADQLILRNSVVAAWRSVVFLAPGLPVGDRFSTADSGLPFDRPAHDSWP
jgi:hypothetical protein